MVTVYKNSKINTENYIKKFKNASKVIDKQTLFVVAEYLDVHYKEGATFYKDNKMVHDENKCNIVNITKIFRFNSNKTLDNLIKDVKKESKSLYTFENGFTLVKNIDTNICFEIGNMGIDKTFSKKVPIEKIFTYYKLKEILENGIYFITTYSIDDPNDIKFHHFLSVINFDNKNQIVRFVVKEYGKNSNLNNKFYYHQFEYLNI